MKYNPYHSFIIAKTNNSLPRIDFKKGSDLRCYRKNVQLRYSPLVDLYLKSRHFHTKELVSGYKMRFSQYNGNEEE